MQQLTKYQQQTIRRAENIIRETLKTEHLAFTDSPSVKRFCSLKLFAEKREHFMVLFLDNQHRLIADEIMFSGTIDGSSVYPREVARRALELNCAAVIFAHNHPSGMTEPSQADRRITNKLKDALHLFEIRVLDHIITGDIAYSFAEHQLI